MQWFAQAPSNIALIKYMGKKEGGKNIPTNPSLSYTLNDLLSTVTLELNPGKRDCWEPLMIPGVDTDFALPIYAQERFLAHLAALKAYFKYSGSFIVRSTNNFPHSSGLASSASSFAALTKCACLALSELTNIHLPTVETQAQLSRQGSGSSCRSFFSPWALWEDENVHAIEFPYGELIHQAILISHEEKKVSSSAAHELIRSSKTFTTRVNRAENNLKGLITALQSQDWESAFQISWREFQDMHRLFATSNPPFSYLNDQSRQVLELFQQIWQHKNDGPIVTMDAGPNIHLLYRPDQKDFAAQIKKDYLVGNYDIL
jgi:diphosphomevalonate decarboxylase